MTTTTMVCAGRGCDRPLTPAIATYARNGQPYCKRHADRLPKNLRQQPRRTTR